MIPISLKLRGAIGVWKGLGLDEIQIDFTRFDNGLLAFIGSNGSAKTTTLENLHPYRQLVSREGSLQNHFRLRDSFRDYTFTLGSHTYRANILIDAQTGKQEAYLYEDGRPLNDGKTGTYDAQVEKLLGSAELYFRSIFSAQKAESIASLTAGQRKELFLELLGLQRYGAYEQFAKSKADGLEGDIQLKRGAIEILNKTANESLGLQEQLQAAEAELTRFSRSIEDVTKEADRAGEELSTIEKQITAEQEKRIRLEDLEKQIAGIRAEQVRNEQELTSSRNAITSRITALQEEIKRERDILSHAPEIGEKVKRLEFIRATEKALAGKKSELAAIEVEEAEAKLHHERTLADHLRQTQTVEAALEGLRRDEEKLTTGWDREIAGLERELTAGEKTAALVNEVPCAGLTGIPEKCKLLKTAILARERLPEVRSTIATMMTSEWRDIGLASIIAKRTELQGQRDRLLGSTPRNGIDFSSRKAAVGYARVGHESLLTEIVLLENQGWERLKGELAVAEGIAAEKEIQLQDFRKQDAALAEKAIAVARQRVQDLEQRTKERDRILASMVSDATWKYRETLRTRVPALRDQVQELSDRRIAVSSTIGVHRAALERAEKAAADAAVAELETSALGAKLARWRLLQQACGKDGIPALELDAAGPEVSRIANELLASTFGARFQIAFETVRLSRDKKKQIETFEIRVFGEGDEQKIEDLSGGEAVWVETAIRLAIAAYMKQKSGRDIASRQFDEADGALSGENAQHYLDMIRKSHDEGGFYFTFIISHRQDLVGQIRQQIIFEKGSGIRLVA